MSTSASTLTQSETKESRLIDNTASLDAIVEEEKHNQSICFDGSSVINSKTHDSTILRKRGYRKLNKICDSLQGEIFKALKLSNHKYVAIKRTNKSLHNESIAIQDDTTFMVSENAIKEALILHRLTVSNKCIGGYIIQWVDFFESDTDYYLVIEYIKSQLNMKQFVDICFRYMDQGKFSLAGYMKMMKYLYWQLVVTVQWLHDSMHCTHLDICLENIMIANCNFILGPNGKYKLNKNVSIKLIDFGVAEMFNITATAGFECNKQKLSLDNEPYLAPKVYSMDRTFDARASDMWSCGMVLYECLIGERLYEPNEIWECDAAKVLNVQLKSNGYWSLHNNKLYSYVTQKNKYGIFKVDSYNLLNGLLCINEANRLNAMNILKHKWFKSYYNNYCKQIEKKHILQQKRLQKQKSKLTHFPFYAFEKFNADNIF